jgi:hypothetical protein
MGADLATELRRVGPHQPIDTIGGDRHVEPAGGVVLDRPEQRTVFIGAVPGGLKVIVNECVGAGMQRQIPRLAALAGDLEMRHAFGRVPGILDPELAQFLAPQRVEQQRRENNGAISLALGGLCLRRIQQLARLVIADRRASCLRRFPFSAARRLLPGYA